MKPLKTIITITMINAMLLVAMVLSAGEFQALRNGQFKSVLSSNISSSTNHSGSVVIATATPVQRATSTNSTINTSQVAGAESSGIPTGTTGGTDSGGSVVVEPTAAPAMAVEPTADPRCIIAINGVQYNVTEFRNIHSGGNIFTCGTDMTATFFGQHNDATLQRMQQYKI